MKRQKEMEEALLLGHHQFVSNLENAVHILEAELREASELRDVCTAEWCSVVEDLFDDVHKEVYALSEPRWMRREDSARLKDLRNRVKSLYAQFQRTR